MPSIRKAFDLALSYPQWQGSGRPENLPRGAKAAAAVIGRYAPLVEVPLANDDAEVVYGVRHGNAIFAQFRSALAILEQSGAKRVLAAGGDCAVDVAIIGYLNRVHSGLNVIWVDAHFDANTPETTPSGNFHGMPVSAILGRAPEPMRALLGEAVDPARFHYLGIRVGDEGDLALQRELGLTSLDPQASIDGPVHIHFDLDVLDPQDFSHVAYPDGALRLDEAVAWISRIARTADVVGFTVTEFAPVDDDSALEGSDAVTRLCDAVAQAA